MLTNEKKLQIRSELVRHLTTAEQQFEAGAPSSAMKVITLNLDIIGLEAGVNEPNMELWNKVFEEEAPRTPVSAAPVRVIEIVV